MKVASGGMISLPYVLTRRLFRLKPWCLEPPPTELSVSLMSDSGGGLREPAGFSSEDS
eukprot:CAMPEP_0118953168 /NCGR_PEP_ID=MMETSP1169-20130426/56088_1 /TAXON_ID=36882 /ORGANISM="Pyramimonas obovata, Strain CCMP722" /LENGTH=57 /DNA_ID=CAMNT_0006900561 /DNA_START=80 /DNA_END=250 /DNA_ORIENTATION=+